MITAIQFIEIQKICLWKKWDKSLADMMQKEKIIQKKKFLLFPLYFLKRKYIDLAILQEIGILQLQFSTCFIVCCVTTLFFELVLYQSYHPYTGRPV